MQDAWAFGRDRSWHAGDVRSLRRRMLRALAGTAFAACLLVVTATSAFPAIAALLGHRVMAVVSGSMRPTIDVGSAVLLAPADPASISEGDVVTYTPYGARSLTTHRVVSVQTLADGKKYLQTKGDANRTPDANLTPLEAVLGRVVIDVPQGGRLLVFATNPRVRLFLLGYPVLVIVAGELRGLRAGGKKDRRRRAERGTTPKAGSLRRWIPAHAAAILVVAALSLALVGAARQGPEATAAQLTDVAVVPDNTFSTALQFP